VIDLRIRQRKDEEEATLINDLHWLRDRWRVTRNQPTMLFIISFKNINILSCQQTYSLNNGFINCSYNNNNENTMIHELLQPTSQRTVLLPLRSDVTLESHAPYTFSNLKKKPYIIYITIFLSNKKKSSCMIPYVFLSETLCSL
jgi:hypothetical protein